MRRRHRRLDLDSTAILTGSDDTLIAKYDLTTAGFGIPLKR
jgi:hypothetical protein